MPYYAVSNGRNIGIFLNWTDCNNSIKGYNNALYKKFDTKEEADHFIQINNNNNNNNNDKDPDITLYPVKNVFKSTAENFIPDYYVYTDGSCSNNGQYGCVGRNWHIFWYK